MIYERYLECGCFQCQRLRTARQPQDAIVMSWSSTNIFWLECVGSANEIVKTHLKHMVCNGSLVTTINRCFRRFITAFRWACRSCCCRVKSNLFRNQGIIVVGKHREKVPKPAAVWWKWAATLFFGTLKDFKEWCFSRKEVAIRP